MDKQNIHEANLGTVIANATRTFDLRARVKEHPYGTLAAAAGAGYVLAGGLFTRLTARAVKLGLRAGASMAVWPFLQKELVELAGAFRAARTDRSAQVRSCVSDARASKERAPRHD